LKSLDTWAKRWGMSKQTVRTYLSIFKRCGMIHTVSNTVSTRLKVLNYDTYNPLRHGFHTVANTLPTPEKEVKEVIKEKPYVQKVQDFFESPEIFELQSLWQKTYPHLDIVLETGSAKMWLIENPKKQKKDFKKFVGGWMRRAKPKPVEPEFDPSPAMI